MTTTNLYYTPPSDSIFKEVQLHAMDLWREIDIDNDLYGYASEKIGRICDLKNVSDNFMYMVAMFDILNQVQLAARLSTMARLAIRKRLIAGGMPEGHIVF